MKKIVIAIFAVGMIFSSGCNVTVALNVLNNRSSQPTASKDAIAENATDGGADIKPDVTIPVVP